MRTRMLLGVTLLLLGSLLHACGDDSVMPEGNQPPDTSLHASSPRAEAGGFAVDFRFSGSDPDGHVAYFEWRLASDTGLQQPWARIYDTELSLFFPDDPDDFGFEDGRAVRSFSVRAVDDRGLADQTASVADFTPLSVLPDVHLVSAPLGLSCLWSGRVVTLHWTAVDADSKSGAPEFIRHLLIPASQGAGDCLTRTDYQLGGWISTGDPRWSDWIAYDPGADSDHPSRSWTSDPLEIGESFLFAVQARDADGASSRRFDWGSQVIHFKVADSRFPLLVVTETTFGTDAFVLTGTIKNFDIDPGQSLDFSWSADAVTYLGEIDGYRYGWDLLDANDPEDANWSVEWGDWASAPTQSYGSGTHDFVVQTRDRAGVLARATYRLTVVEP